MMETEFYELVDSTLPQAPYHQVQRLYLQSLAMVRGREGIECTTVPARNLACILAFSPHNPPFILVFPPIPYKQTCSYPKQSNINVTGYGFCDISVWDFLIHNTCVSLPASLLPHTTIFPLTADHSRHPILPQVAARSHIAAGQGGAAGKNHGFPWKWCDSVHSSLHHGDSKVNVDEEVAAKGHTLF